ncbi:OmpA family protein [Altererythrobacter sp. H2]|uniref:OmpA family protein n=1 Tax=Altererythrobacter sp. H2 TaxID=3108391 RepID=UPI002B4C18F6|nr:OmpA family protein [Altererythrobacter sp. H2]WRK96931.1 OmpA family protein [Altererythrobacter sp. H2]
MTLRSPRRKALTVLAALAVPAAVPGTLIAQEQAPPQDEAFTTVYGTPPADLSALDEGPEVEGFIAARKDNRMRVTNADGTTTDVFLSEATEVRASKGLFGLDRDRLAPEALLNGLPVTVRTVQWGNGLIASRIALKTKDLRTATMIRTGTEQGFAEQTAATDALRSRVADIDQYNVKGTTNVYFDTGKWNISGQSQAELCATAAQAEAMDNALLLVVGYTDSTGDYDFNQELSEKRAARVVNYLQQACKWKPYRMLTPTGMAEADPAADNSTAQGKAQNRRVAVNILVSKSVDGL